MSSMRILIADDQPKARFALRVALEQRPGFKAIGEAIDAADLLTQTNAIYPDLVLIDWELPGLPLADLLAQLRRACGNMRAIILSSRAETRGQALAAGADAFVCKCDAPDELLAAIDHCLKPERTPIKDHPAGEAENSRGG
jgi:DNA-binding NarL/FixJ family response regulator